MLFSQKFASTIWTCAKQKIKKLGQNRMCGAKSLLRVAMLKDSTNRDGFDFVVLHIDVENNTLIVSYTSPSPALSPALRRRGKWRPCNWNFCMWKMSGTCNTLECSPILRIQVTTMMTWNMFWVSGDPKFTLHFPQSQHQWKVRKLAFCSPQKKWHKPKLPICTPNHFP